MSARPTTGMLRLVADKSPDRLPMIPSSLPLSASYVASHLRILARIIAGPKIALLATIISVAASSACGNHVEPTPPQYADPRRVDIREGLFLREGEFGDANFSAVLPFGWKAADEPMVLSGFPAYTPTGQLNPAGAIVKAGDRNASARYQVLPPVLNATTDTALEAMHPEVKLRLRSGYVIEELDLDGVSATLVAPSEQERMEYQKLFVLFPWLPGDADRKFGLLITANGINSPAVMQEIREIVTSIRHADAPPRPPANPTPEVSPHPTWRRVYAHWYSNDSRNMFSVLAPPGWEYTPGIGLDSLVGSFSNGVITIGFDYGSASASPVGYDNHLRDPDYSPEHRHWFEILDNKPVLMFRPVSEHTHERAETGITVTRLPGLPDLEVPEGSISSRVYDCGGSFWATGIEPGDQELVLAILRTIRAEDSPGNCL